MVARRRVEIVAGKLAADDNVPVGQHRHRLDKATHSPTTRDRVEGCVARPVGVEPHHAVVRRPITVITGELAADDDLSIGL